MLDLLFDDDTPGGRTRDEIDAAYKWNLEDIYPGWESWEADIQAFGEDMDALVAMRGTLGDGPEQVLRAYELSDRLGERMYKLYRFPQLHFDLNQKDNEILARLQQVQQVLAEYSARTSWFAPEILTIDQGTMEEWIAGEERLKPYEFPISEVYRNQEHVRSEEGEEILAFGSRFRQSPVSVYQALTTADVEFNTVELSDGESVKVTYAKYGNILRTHREQSDRQKAFRALYSLYEDRKNTFAAIYSSICQRDWAQAQARRYESTAAASLDARNVPVSVLETLIETATEGRAPLQRYHKLRKEVLGLEEYQPYDGMLPLLDLETEYPYDEVLPLLVESVEPLGEDYQRRLSEAVSEGWIDVYETEGKRSGAYSAGVYGVHPYMLLNYTDTLNDVFTLAHELGHTLHTELSCEFQPFATSGYTIFVAEVASTVNEALLLEHMLHNTEDPREKAALLEHAIQNISGTFYTQALYADYELAAHRAVEAGQPITAEVLEGLYIEKMKHLYGDSMEIDDLYRMSWARIPHFFNSPYYVYQYATCFASTARIMESLLSDDEETREDAVDRYLTLLKSGGNDHPMEQLKRAGADLSDPSTVGAVIDRMEDLVNRFEEALKAL